MKYIDVEKLKDEIESISFIPQTSADYNDGRDDIKMMFLDIIDSLHQERSKVDLEKEVDKWYNNEASKEFENVLYEDIEKCAKHFYELGLNTK